MADTKRALKNNRVVLALTKSTVRFIRNKKEKRFLIYTNVAIGGSRFIAVSVTVPFLFKEVFPILGQNLFQTQIEALRLLQKAAILTYFYFS